MADFMTGMPWLWVKLEIFKSIAWLRQKSWALAKLLGPDCHAGAQIQLQRAAQQLPISTQTARKPAVVAGKEKLLREVKKGIVYKTSS